MKRTTALITTAAIIFGAAPAVWAAETDYEKLIPDVKNRMEIPAEYSDFKCTRISETEDGTEYQFKWSIPGDDTYKSINLSCDSDGVITSYNNWQDSDEYDYLKTDIASAKQTAERFAVRMNPALEGKLRIEADMSGYNWGAVFFLVYEEHNGIEYDRQIGGVSVASDGTVTNAYIDEPDFSDEDVSKLITAAEAYNEYMEYAAPLLVYCTYTDEDDSIKTFPAYIKGNRKAVSAVTGELIEPGSNYELYAASNAMGMAEDAGDEAYSRLTESETAETAKLRGYISSGDAVKRVSDFLGIELQSSNVHLNVGRKTGTYYFYSDINSSYVSASVDASNGDILSLSCYDADNSTKLKNCDFSDEETARKLIDAAAPNNAKKLEYDMGEAEEYGIMPIAKDDSDNVSKASYFCYKVNGIEVMDGGASIRSSAERGGISYRIAVTRLDEIAAAEYDAPDSFISAGEALKQEDFRLRYVMTEDGARAAYLTDDFRINAITGKRVDCRNEEIKEKNGKYAYSDIGNHWVKQAAEQLALAGIGFEGGMLLPDEPVTAEEAYELLDRQYYSYEKTFKDVKELLTRNQTAEIITDCMGLAELSKTDIFKAPYSDMTENYGAAAILKGYGIIAADADTFRPNDKITRAEFLQMLYNTLISKR